MKDLIESNTSELTMSSVQLAEVLNARHDNLMTAIQRLEEQGLLTTPSSKESSKWASGNGTVRTRYIWRLGKRDTFLVASKYNDVMRAKIIDAWIELEESASGNIKVPTTLHEALRLAADKEESLVKAKSALATEKVKNEILGVQVEEGKDAMEFVEATKVSNDHMLIAEYAKMLDIPVSWLYNWFNNNMLNQNRTPKAKYVNYGYMSVKQYKTPTGTINATPIITAKGRERLYKRIRYDWLEQQQQIRLRKPLVNSN